MKNDNDSPSVEVRPYFSLPEGEINVYEREIPWFQHDSTRQKRELSISDEFEVLNEIGVGDSYTLHRAFWKRFRYYIALKMFKGQQSNGNHHRLSEAEAEIRALKKLKHPNIIGLFGSVASKNNVYILLELVDSGSLLNIADPGNSEMCQKWFAQIASAVAFMHGKYIAHRNLKCENILVNAHKDVKVVGFGLAMEGLTWTESASNSEFRKISDFTGPIAYAPPEKAAKSPYSPILADVWAMGVILYGILRGKFPLADMTPEEVMKLPQKFEGHNSDADVVDLLTRLLSVEKDRIRSYEVLEHDFLKNRTGENFVGTLGHMTVPKAIRYLKERNLAMHEGILKRLKQQQD